MALLAGAFGRRIPSKIARAHAFALTAADPSENIIQQ
jgi:hypothetical protein